MGSRTRRARVQGSSANLAVSRSPMMRGARAGWRPQAAGAAAGRGGAGGLGVRFWAKGRAGSLADGWLGAGFSQQTSK